MKIMNSELFISAGVIANIGMYDLWIVQSMRHAPVVHGNASNSLITTHSFDVALRQSERRDLLYSEQALRSWPSTEQWEQ